MYRGRGRTTSGGRPFYRGGYSDQSSNPDYGMSEGRGRRSPNMSPWSGSRHSNHENAAVYRPRMPLPVGTGLQGQNDTLETQGTSDALSHCSSSMGLNRSVEGEKIELSLVEETESCAVSLLHHDLSHNVNISGSVDKSEPSQERNPPQSSSGIDDSNQVECQAVIEHFDICLPKIGTPVMLKPSLLVKNREKRNEIKRSAEGQIGNVLRPGMVLLKKYLSLADQVKIVRACRALGLGSGGFYQPGYRDGAKLHLKMMCLGKNWDPETGNYGDLRPIDRAVPPGIPREFFQLVEKVIKDSHSLVQLKTKASHVEHILPSMKPNICIVNFYSASGRLGLHQDKDESPESLHKGLPVISFSIGDAAEFLYGDQREVDKAEKVELESGDVLVFGGSSRLIFHGVTAIKQKTAPGSLLEETNLRPGRLNLTFREY
ncbi:hypothetical protein ERO13_A06G194000v2 [Gossypium hirsutum]|uniref:Fe2OG dioxygenase domain-containing protein n=2 Tax=Gossypium TaxID=3633 RepID=A0ABM3BZ06_GOSHI|nr:uncharacterized protein LOC121230845 [Gossypium hirsutum]KAG4196798.1 hypothetical protein ERO13_A06G194000v2 [Gossypium hirsutum]TYI24383.1 hypothetical protein ES332_A06G230300v1 [Gossypium tomentosum]